MERKQQLVEARKFFDDCMKILERKGHDYAQDADVFSNFKKMAAMSGESMDEIFIFFLSVKLARLTELKNKDPKNESRQDTLKDKAIYACLYFLWILNEEEPKKWQKNLN